MKHILSFVTVFILLASCTSDDSTQIGDFAILPSPQKLNISGASDLSPSVVNFTSKELTATASGIAAINEERPHIDIQIDPSLDIAAEGYRLKIGNEKIEITGKDPAGAFYGLMTLKQLSEDATDQGVNLPIVEIEDFPLLTYRAIHLDVKHHTETLHYYYELMDRLASFKINGIIAEVEDKIKYTRQPLVGSADAFSKEDWADLSTYALERNIEISPLVQGLGHASFVLKHPEYVHLRDNPKSDWAFNPLDPEYYELQYDLYLDAIEALPHGRYLHIGGDEVHTTGRGSGQSALELQLIWLDKVCKWAAENDRIPIFWDDMPLKHAEVYRPMFDRKIAPAKVDSIWTANESNLVEFIDLFPKNCIYMRWNYQTPETYGNLKAMDWFIQNGFQAMGATAGQTRWSLMPQAESNIDNIRSFALSSIDKKLDGLLLTLWDDDSPHFELYMRGIMAFAEYTWAGDQRTKADYKVAFQQRAFGHALKNPDFDFIDKLEAPVAFWKNALLQEKQSRNNLRKFDDPLKDAVISLPDPENKGQWVAENEDRLRAAPRHMMVVDSISRYLETALPTAGRNKYTLEVYQQVTELVQFSLSALTSLHALDVATGDAEEAAFAHVLELQDRFASLRNELEEVYGKVRVLNKPDNYILDQDHHTHNANQSLNFDWQFYPEMLLIEKIKELK